MKNKFFLLILFVLFFFPFFAFAAEVEQNRTINSSVGKFQNQFDSLDLATSVDNTNMTVGSGNNYYLLSSSTSSDPRRYYFRRYFTNLQTSLINGDSYHVRIVFFRESGIAFNWYGSSSSNRCLNNVVTAQNDGVNVTNLTSSITRASSTATVNGKDIIYDRYDIYFTSNRSTNNLSISIGQLTSCSYMYYNNSNPTLGESKVIGINGIYVWHGAADQGTNEQDMIAQQKQSNSFLGQISQKITDITIMLYNLIQDIGEKIDNFKSSVENKFNQLINFFSDTSIDSNSTSQKFGEINSSSETPITDLISMPLVLLNKIYSGFSGSCSAYTLGTLFNYTIILPCFDGAATFGSTVWNIIDGLFVFFMLYNIGMMVVSFFEKVTSLQDTFDEMYQPQHSYKPNHGGGK